MKAPLNWLKEPRRMLTDYFRAVDGADASEIRVLRIRRIAVTSCLVLLSAVSIARALDRPDNLARGKAVSASSQSFNTTPAGAVDGYRYGQLGFHSKEENGAWLVVDLGSEREIGRVVAYGRADCCFNQSVPLLLELSGDGAAYRTIAERKAPFSQFDPWITDLHRERARFVRIKTRKRAFLVVSEVEVLAP